MDFLKTKIHPVPKLVTWLDTAPLCLTSIKNIAMSAPSQEGPINTAVEMLRKTLADRWEFSEEGFPVKLELGDPPADMQNPQEGYRLQIGENGIAVTGFGEKGLLYGVISLLQVLKEDTLPSFEVLDWPDKPMRGIKQESRWGSNVMERDEWFAMIDDLVQKKMNTLAITMYCCWNVQYDGRMAEYLYFPVKKYPQLQTPMLVKYYSPSQGKWVEEQTLPPIFRDDLFGQIVTYAKQRGILVIPSINSFGHNTYLPRTLPEVSPKDADGNPTNSGFCTRAKETYDLLFAMYDQLIEDYLLPNGMRAFGIGLDEVRAEYATDPARPDKAPSPWCECHLCRTKTKQEIFVDHAVKLISHLKEKGMDTVGIYYDMLLDHPKGIGNVAEKFYNAVQDNGLQDVLLCQWWYYYDTEYRLRFHDCHDEFGLRSTANPWNGYYNWSLLTNATRNVKLMADMGHNAKNGEGMILYSMWDKSADRIHDYFADLGWNYQDAGSPEQGTARYAARIFGTMEAEACRGFELMERCTYQQKENKSPDAGQIVLSNYDTLYRACYYPYSYYSPTQPYPRHFPGEGLRNILPLRAHYEQRFRDISAMAQEAAAIFQRIAEEPGCDRVMARRLSYECENYRNICEDWLAFLRIYDLTAQGEQKEIASLARARQNARLAQMAFCENVKDAFLLRGAAMRELCVFMQTFGDIADYAESRENFNLDILDIANIASKALRNIR